MEDKTMKKLIITILTAICILSVHNRPSAQGFADSPWPMYGHVPEHTHRGVQAPPATNLLKWKFKTEGTVYAPSIGEDGTIYAGSYDRHVYALNPDGTLKWKFTTDSPIIESTPAIGSDGTIYIGSSWINPNSKAFFYALNPDGTLKWKYDTGSAISRSPVIGYDGTIFFGSSDSFLYALDADGNLQWKYKFAGINTQWPAVGNDGSLYFSSGDSFLYSLNSDGSLRWKYGPDIVLRGSPSIGEDGTIYVPSYRNLAAFNPDGTIKWIFRTENSYIINASPAIGSDGTIYIGSLDKSLYAVNHDGTLKWKFTTDGPIRNAAAIGSDGCIYVPSGEEDHYMRAINPDGTLRWEFAIGRASTPVIGADGTLYFGSDIGYLCALEPEQETAVDTKALSFSVEEPRPNPFNPSTTIEITLPVHAPVRLEVYTVTGQKIATLMDGSLSAGRHSFVFDGSKYASGIFFYRFESNAGIKTGKMLLIK